MATVKAIRDALQTRLATISGLEVYDTVPGQINPPAAVIRRRSGPRPATLGNAAFEYTFAITLITSLADDRAAQDKLDDYLSSGGALAVIAALEADSDLGGVVEYAEVRDIEADEIFEYAASKYLGADVLVDIGAT